MADDDTRRKAPATNSGKATRTRLSAPDAVRRVREDLPALLGRPVETVLGVEATDEEGWEVTVQVVEMTRIPSSTDVLGAYAVSLDGDGEVAGYHRRRRYHRNQVMDD